MCKQGKEAGIVIDDISEDYLRETTNNAKNREGEGGKAQDQSCSFLTETAAPGVVRAALGLGDRC